MKKIELGGYTRPLNGFWHHVATDLGVVSG